MIAVVGATGNTGQAVVKELQALGQNPLCIVRNPDKARALLGETRTAVADLADGAALERALQGVTGIFLVTGHNPQMANQESNVLDSALKAGVKYLVHVSAVAAVATHDSEAMVGRSHFAIEEKLRRSRIGWTILRPGLFMQNMLGQAPSIKNEGKIFFPFANELPLALVDVRDTAAVGARILIDPAPHVGKTYEITGPVTTYAAFAESLSEVLRREIAYVGVSLEQAERTMKAHNMPIWLVDDLLAIAKSAQRGAFSVASTKPIAEIAKRAPLTTRQFAEHYKSHFTASRQPNA